MQINYLGHSCFKIKSRDITLIIDPFDDYIGFSLPKTKADIVVISHQHKDHNCLANIEGEPFVIQNPGEYEISDVSVFGMQTFHDNQGGQAKGKNIVYNIQAEEISLCHLGDLGHMLNDRQLEEINGVDILFAPVGGVFTLDIKQIIELIKKIEPSIIIPMHYRTNRHNQNTFGQLAALDDFLVEFGAPDAEIQEKLIVQKNSFSNESQVVPLAFK